MQGFRFIIELLLDSKAKDFLKTENDLDTARQIFKVKLEDFYKLKMQAEDTPTSFKDSFLTHQYLLLLKISKLIFRGLSTELKLEKNYIQILQEEINNFNEKSNLDIDSLVISDNKLKIEIDKAKNVLFKRQLFQNEFNFNNAKNSYKEVSNNNKNNNNFRNIISIIAIFIILYISADLLVSKLQTLTVRI